MSFEWISTTTVLLLYYGVQEAGGKWDALEHLTGKLWKKKKNVGMAILVVKPSLYLTRGQLGVMERKPCSLISHGA